MSGIGTVTPTDARLPAQEHRRVDRDGRKPPREPRKPPSSDDLVDSEPHNLDVEA